MHCSPRARCYCAGSLLGPFCRLLLLAGFASQQRARQVLEAPGAVLCVLSVVSQLASIGQVRCLRDTHAYLALYTT